MMKAWASRRSFSSVVEVPAARLNQLLEAEITSLALKHSRPLTLRGILDLTSEKKDDQMAQYLHEELPVAFAKRIKMLEALPNWQDKASIASVRQRYVSSFKELRLADPAESRDFQVQLKRISVRHAHTNLLVESFKQYAADHEVENERMNEWLDRFFTSRMTSNMLMSHYLHVTTSSVDLALLDADPASYSYRSSIDPQCDVSRIVKLAAETVSEICRVRYGVDPPIVVRDSSAPFMFVPCYLFYIVSELLKNAARATVETHCSSSMQDPSLGESDSENLPPIEVLISGDENVCTIRVCDQGGGIPVKRLTKVFSYLFSTASPVQVPGLAVDAPADIREYQEYNLMNSMADPMSTSFGKMQLDQAPSAEARAGGGSCDKVLRPLAGLGCGLPLSRLYARYLGGDIELKTLPHYGTDVFVYLSKVGASSETTESLCENDSVRDPE